MGVHDCVVRCAAGAGFEDLIGEVRLLRQGGTNPIPDQNCCLTGMDVCLPRVLEGPVGGTRLPIRGNQKSEPEEALIGKSLRTKQRNRMATLVSLLAIAALRRLVLLPHL